MIDLIPKTTALVQELSVARMGKSMDRSTGSLEILPLFEQTSFRLDFLTDPTGLMDFGIDFKKVKVTSRVQADDSAFVIAYPHFNVNGVCHAVLPFSKLNEMSFGYFYPMNSVDVYWPYSIAV